MAIAAATGGCSADVTRFDPAFNLTSNSDRAATGSLPVPSEPMARSYPRFDEPPAPRGPDLSSEARGGYGTAAASAGSGERVASARDYSDPPPRAAMAPTSDRFTARHIDRVPSRYEAGDTIEVQPGDSIFGIAKRYGVSIAALIELNGLTNGSSLQPGQRITLPAGARRVREDTTAARAPAPAASAPTAVAAASAPPPQRPSAAPSPPASGWDGQHTMKAGESLYGIARQHGVALAELQRVNGITEPTRVRIGTVLRIPGKARPAPERTALQSAPAAAPRAVQNSMSAPPGKARLINSSVEQEDQPPPQRKTAALSDRTTDASPARFRWPVRGRIIANFGKRPDGTHNDGINLAVPQGTDISAVEGGRVAYAGSELKGYGNLVLIRHDNGWVSAYAHADQILVKRDDVVRRGQVIAKAGRTGTVDQPQLHFELRQGSKPVDPVPHLEN